MTHTVHFSRFEDSYPALSSVPAWKKAGMAERLAGIASINTMGFCAEDLATMEQEARATAALIARETPALEAARLKAMGVEQKQTGWTWFNPWPTQRPAAA